MLSWTIFLTKVFHPICCLVMKRVWMCAFPQFYRLLKFLPIIGVSCGDWRSCFSVFWFCPWDLCFVCLIYIHVNVSLYSHLQFYLLGFFSHSIHPNSIVTSLTPLRCPLASSVSESLLSLFPSERDQASQGQWLNMAQLDARSLYW